MEQGNTFLYQTIEKLEAKIDRDLDALEAREIEAIPREQKARELAEAGIDMDRLHRRIKGAFSGPPQQVVDSIDPSP